MRQPDVPRLPHDATDDAPTAQFESSDDTGRRTPRSSARAGGKRRAPARRGHGMFKIFGVTMLVLSLVVGLGMVYLYRHFNGNLTVVDPTEDIVADRPDREDTGTGEPLNILVMGSDSRDCDGCALDQHTETGQRSDTTILIHLSGNRKRAYGISIPRDTMVDRPKCKTESGDIEPAADYQMWNSAFGVGGPACTIAQVEQVSNVRVDHFVVVDFNSFKSMVDAINGVEVCIPETVDDSAHDIYLEEGTRKISGEEALAYVRVRKGIGDGSDLSRTKRQQAFIGAMANQVLSSGTLANPVKVVRLLDAATKGLTVDPGLGDIQSLADLGLGFQDIGLDKIQFLTAPVGADPSDPNRVVFSQDAKKMWRKIRKDKALGRDLSGQSLRANSLPGAKEAAKQTQAEDEPDASGEKKNKKKKSQAALDAEEREFAGLCA